MASGGMRSTWKGPLTFGLVIVPVRLITATESKDISFRQVHVHDDGAISRIKQVRMCITGDHEVEYSDMSKGYEGPDGGLVEITADELAALPLPTLKQLEVLQFVPEAQISPLMSAGSKVYFVDPEPAGARAYVLLATAMAQAGVVAVAKVALRQRESLAVIRVNGEGVMTLTTLLWPNEVRDAALSFIGDATLAPRPQELTMAGSLIETMTGDFDPDAYHDDYQAALVQLVEAKIAGVPMPAPEPRVQPASTSLMDALSASLKAAKAAAPEPQPEAAAPKRATTRKTAAKPAEDEAGVKPAARQRTRKSA